MSDAYEIDGVKIDPIGGGYYDLTHSSLAAPERVRGKESADARAAEIAKATPKQDGGDDDGNAPLTQSDLTQVAGTPVETPAPAAEIPAAASEDPRDAQIRVMQEQMKTMLEALQNVTTVQATQAPPIDQLPHSIPRQFDGQMDAKTKRGLADAGVSVSTIILEENESIPPTGLFIGHNGRSYMIKPGEKVDVPDFLIGVLDDAVMSAPIVDSDNRKVLGYRDRSKYPYRRV